MTDQKFNKIFPFDTPRKYQRELIEQVLSAYQSGKHHVILNAPTGIGKSAISFAVANFFKTAYVLTSQKILQEQYYRELNIPFVLGKTNYACSRNRNLNCEMGECKGTFNCSQDCPYIHARQNAINAQISNFNYSLFLMINRASFQLPVRNLIICDECHNLENYLINTSTLSISKKTLENLGIQTFIQIPKVKDNEDYKFKWLFTDLKRVMVNEWTKIEDNLKRVNKWEFLKKAANWGSKKRMVGNYLDAIVKIEQMYNLKQKIVLTQEKDDAIEFKILFGNKLFEHMIAPYGKYFLHMSATVLSKENFCGTLGLIPDDVEYIQCESTFPVENRMIYYDPVGSMIMKHKEKTLPKLVEEIKKILKKYPNDKGIIHTVNYQTANYILEQLWGSEEGARLLKPQGKNRETLIKTFNMSQNPYVLISPSLTEGIDLKDDLSRFCIICKVPYPSIADNWTKQRIELDQNWYNVKTAETLIQMTVRSIRSETDHAETYILDFNFLEFAGRNPELFPTWWQESVVQI